jgi:drug/metabolite transporter (DMT)-like permease
VTAIFLALGASLFWGVADFVGPVKGRTLGPLRVLLYVQAAGLAVIAVVVALLGHAWPGPRVLLAVPAALSGTLGLYAYYRGMLVGSISIVAPVAGASAVIPVGIGIATGDRPSVPQLAGIAAALVGVALASREPGETDRRLAAGVGLALIAAVGFGFYFPPMHIAGSADPWWASLLFRTTSTTVICVAVLVRRPPVAIRPLDLAVVSAVGIGDMLGNLCFAASSGHGLVSVTAVLASLYPVVTIALARAVLAERVARSQQIGIVLTLAGVALISVG